MKDTHTSDSDARVAEEEELVQPGDDDGPDETDKPSTEGRAGHVDIVGVGDGSTDLRVGGVVLCNLGQ